MDAEKTVPGLENFDEFDDATDLPSTFCSRVTEEEYENQTSEATEAALNDLCQLLESNPGIYYQILQQRKKEEMENSGLFSYFKVKMMNFLQGDKYTASLLSEDALTHQLNQLKDDMHKAFVYSEESKGRRFSKRLAANRERGNTKENTPLLHNSKPMRRIKLDTFKAGFTPILVGQTPPRVLRSASRQKTLQERSPKSPSAHEMVAEPLQTANFPAHLVDAPPPPPPTPPPPPLSLLISTSVPVVQLHRIAMPARRNLRNKMPETNAVSGSRKRNFQEAMGDNKSLPLQASPTQTALLEKGHLFDQALVQNGEMGSGSQLVDGKEQDIGTSPASISSSPSDTEFVTPESDFMPNFKRHIRTLSSDSTGSQHSLNSLHSELLSSNPISRLRATQIARSPGGTPLRSLVEQRTPQEPLHRALVTLLRQKFRNVRTPSPMTARFSTSIASPTAGSKSNSFNTTFSP